MSAITYMHVLLFTGMCNEFTNSQSFDVSYDELTLHVKNSWLQFLNCFVTKELFNDTDIGSFPNDLEHSKYCDTSPACHRGWGCCMAMRADDVIHGFYLWKSSRPGAISLNWRDPSERRHLTQCTKVVYMVDGWMQIATRSLWMQATRDAYLARHPDYCVIIADWTSSGGHYYFQAVSNIRVIGAAMAFSAFHWNVGSRTIAVGWSLGGHVLGEFGRRYQKISGGRKIADCHSLDPAGPAFDGCQLGVGVDETSCETVQIVHSSGDPPGTYWMIAGMTTGLGSSEKRGKCDWWINGGIRQRFCPEPSREDHRSAMADYLRWVSCSHRTAFNVYMSWISGACDHEPFLGTPCSQCGMSFNPPLPKSSGTVQFLDCQVKGDFYVQATKVRPHCVDGISEDIRTMDKSIANCDDDLAKCDESWDRKHHYDL